MTGHSQVAMSSLHKPLASTAGNCGGGPVLAESGAVEQIAVTLLRLQQDMNSVLVRLQSLETLTQQQANVSL